MRGQIRAALLIIVGVLAVAFVLESTRPTQAMPPFAESYGINCEVCHSSVPALNNYGRYVQRTGYASLDPGTIHQVNPFWVGVSPTYDSSAYPNQTAVGNFALHAAGDIGNDITFHAQQWIVANNNAGFTDTLWVTYNNLLHRDGHLFVGKLQAPAPSAFQQWQDLASFQTPGMTVGEHVYEIAANRWGAKLAYVKPGYFAQFGYVGPSGDLNSAFDFTTQPVDKSFQYWVGYARPDKPIEAGVYGTAGSWPISDGTFDHYTSEAVYVQTDPQHGLPGFFGLYQLNHDPDPAAGVAGVVSHGFSTELTKPIGPRVMLAGRYEMTDDGLGTLTHFGYIDVNYIATRNVEFQRRANGLIVTGQMSMVTGSIPTYQAQVWYVASFGGRL